MRIQDVKNKVSGHKVRLADEQKRLISGLAALLIVLSVGFLGGWLGSASRSHETNLLNSSENQARRQVISNESELISAIAEEVGPSVVSVNVTRQGLSQGGFFGFPETVEQESAGTGVIISTDGYVMTNRHVVPSGTTTVSVTLSDGTELTDVEVVGRTNDSDPLDIAFLKIKDTKNKELKPAAIGDSSSVDIGDKVVAIGNALGQFQNTVTSGIISGYGRSVEAGDASGRSTETLQNLFQTDAAINQGNSGGPLVNLSGEVIGINTAVAGGSAQNIGFAIPINDIQGLMRSVLEKGELLRPYLGIRYVSLTDDYAYTFNLEKKRGAYIVPSQAGQSSVLPGSPAEKAGLQEKDIITKIDGVEVDEDNSVTSLTGRKQVGEEVTLTVYRDGSEQEIEVTLEAAPEQ